MMRSSKGQKQNMLMKIIGSPIRALGKARDAYVRSITSCGQNISYGNPMDSAARFSSLSRSQSAATSRRSDNDGGEDFAELVRAASARTMVSRIDMDLVLKQQQQQEMKNNGVKGNKGLPKSSSVGMGKIDEDKPFEFSNIESGGNLAFVKDSYPRSKSYAVGNRTRNLVGF